VDASGGAAAKTDEGFWFQLGRDRQGMPLNARSGARWLKECTADNLVPQTFPARTEGSVKKHWYKDMHYAEFAEDEVCGTSNPTLRHSSYGRAKHTD
jgi:hypothetical protein